MFSLCKKRAHSPGDASGPRQVLRLNSELLEYFPKIWKILNAYLEFEDILTLTHSNKKIRQLILRWALSLQSNEYFFGGFKPDPNGRFRLFGETKNRSLSMQPEEFRKHFTQFGWFIKGLTALDPIPIRVQRAQDVINRLQLVFANRVVHKQMGKVMRDKSTLSNDSANYENDRILLQSGAIYGYAFIIKICTTTEAFQYLVNNADKRFSVRMTLSKIFDSNYYYGSYGDMEFDTRETLRHLFWNEVPKSLKGQWLKKLLETYCVGCENKEAALLYLMFGPMKSLEYNGTKLTWVMWDEPTNHCDVLEDDFSPLAEALNELHKERYLTYTLLQRLFKDPNNLDIEFCEQVNHSFKLFFLKKFPCPFLCCSASLRLWFMQVWTLDCFS